MATDANPLLHQLEVWLIGPRRDVNAARDLLAGLGLIAQTGDIARLGGEDAGRVRQYLRIHGRREPAQK